MVCRRLLTSRTNTLDLTSLGASICALRAKQCKIDPLLFPLFIMKHCSLNLFYLFLLMMILWWLLPVDLILKQAMFQISFLSLYFWIILFLIIFTILWFMWCNASIFLQRLIEYYPHWLYPILFYLLSHSLLSHPSKSERRLTLLLMKF